MTFKFTVSLKVEADAFDLADAQEMLEESFGTGEQLGLNVTECRYTLEASD